MAEARRSRDDLIQLEYRLHELLLEEREAARKKDATALAADVLGIEVADVVVTKRDVPQPDLVPVQVLLATYAEQVDRELVVGADASESATWATVELGAERVRVPEYVSITFPAGTATDHPLYLRAWPKNHGQGLQLMVYSRLEDEVSASRFLDELIDHAVGPRSPFLHRLVEASAGQFGPALRVVTLEPTTRSSLVLPDHVWEHVRRNIDRMFERMDRLEAAGLGTNRGMILAGPPGTGKSALCRALAHDYEGRATVAIVSASAGQYVLGQLYEKLDRLGPSLVLIEDLDLLVGDRMDRERFPLIQFLTVLDGLMTHHSRVVTIATTNDASLIDAAAARAARFDQVVEIALPDAATRQAILELYLAQVDHDADLAVLAALAEGLSGADLREVVRSAVLDAEGDRVSHPELVGAVAYRQERLDPPGDGAYI